MDELSLNNEIEGGQINSGQQQQSQNNLNNQPPPKKKTHRVMWVIIVVTILLLAISIWFYSLVKKNIDSISNENQSTIYDIESNDDPYAGAVDAKIVIVEFSDFECPFCKKAYPVVKEVISTYGDDIKFIYRDFPLTSIHDQAQKAAEAAECADDQGKFWEMHDKIFDNSPDMSVFSLKKYASEISLDKTSFDECLDSGKYTEEVQNDFASGVVAGVDGTPTFFINGTKFEGAITTENFKSIIDGLLAIYN